MDLPLPGFYEPSSVGTLFIERSETIASSAVAYREKWGIPPSEEDELRIAAFGIDCQVGFCHPQASLFVPGAVGDMQRAVEWIYANLRNLTTLYFSLDTHGVYQIFHPSWWVDPDGHHPAPFTAISADDVREGRWRAVHHADVALEYCERVEASGKYLLTVWPYHTLLGGTSHALLPAVMEAAIFHAVARCQQTHIETKGTHPLTESYSVLSPEVCELGGNVVGGFNNELFQALMTHDRVYVFGEASSHCVLSTLQDMLARLELVDPAMARKIYVLKDAMSPVTPPPLDPLPESLNFPSLAQAALDRFAAAGMNIVTTASSIV
jgi:nicotinamidase-related amidase